MQAKTIEQQIADKCVHFNGIGVIACKAGVKYETFGRLKLGVIPCIKGGTATCELCRYPSEEEVKQQIEATVVGTAKALKLLLAAKKFYKETDARSAKFPCPVCNGTAIYSIAINDHFWIACKTCQISFNE